jgi:hypothetical protein
VAKCAVHSGIEIDFSTLQKHTRPTYILKLLFESKNNIYAAEIKSKLTRSFIMVEYTEFKEALLLNDVERVV